jgi:S-formylglutathione hydrolase FrmB
MALIDCKFYSEVLGMSSSMLVILPQGTATQIGMVGQSGSQSNGFRTLFLLHGLSDDETIWMRRTSIERYVAPLGLAVVMPNAHRSYYTNMAHGLRYWDFVSDELPRIARSFFPLSSRREDTYVAGLSMGGYGALKLALSRPEQFSHAAALSAVTSVPTPGMDPQTFDWVFGSRKRAESAECNLFRMAEAVAPSARPRLYQACGTEDFLYEQNVRLQGHLRQLGYDLTYEEGPGGHDWSYWDQIIKRALDWMRVA